MEARDKCLIFCVCVLGEGGKGEEEGGGEGRTLNFSLIGFSPMLLSCCLVVGGCGDVCVFCVYVL